MVKKRLQLIARVMTTAFMVCATILPLATPVYAAKGNNGTLKVHEIGTPSGTESNDPKVCQFNFEGFSFDSNQSGYLKLDPQGGSSPIGVAAGPFSFGPTDGSGYAISQDFNTPSGTFIANGTYKATLYGKDTGGNLNLDDEKAKSKVFKVDCETGEVIATTAPDPTFTDITCDANGSYTIPESTGVIYEVNGVVTDPGTYSVSSPTTITVTAEAETGYSLEGSPSWSHNYSSPQSCENPQPQDVCPNIEGTQEQVPQGMVVNADGNCVTLPGQGGGSAGGDNPTDPTPPTTPVDTTSTSTNTPTIPAAVSVQTLPATGASDALELFLSALGGLTAMGVSYRSTLKKSE